MKFQIIPSHRNLGCLGFIIGSWYMDFFRTPYFGWYSSTVFGKVWIRLFPRPRLLKREWVSRDGKYCTKQYVDTYRKKGYVQRCH